MATKHSSPIGQWSEIEIANLISSTSGLLMLEDGRMTSLKSFIVESMPIDSVCFLIDGLDWGFVVFFEYALDLDIECSYIGANLAWIDEIQRFILLIDRLETMFLLNLPLNLKEHAAIERRRRQEHERVSRIFNEKYRTIGVRTLRSWRNRLKMNEWMI